MASSRETPTETTGEQAAQPVTRGERAAQPVKKGKGVCRLCREAEGCTLGYRKTRPQ